MSEGQAQTWISNIALETSTLTPSQFDILAQEIGPAMTRDDIETDYYEKARRPGGGGGGGPVLNGQSFLTWANRCRP
ncbi:hypothetical protein BDZ89DRAFT_1125740 [Hymenopellis radicata]|nr:hypothetical protein BDZ89DRAFT_1125740 [Hymenopellis radicata]